MSVAKKLATTAADRMATTLRRSPSFVHSTAIARRAAKKGDHAMVDAALRKAVGQVQTPGGALRIAAEAKKMGAHPFRTADALQRALTGAGDDQLMLGVVARRAAGMGEEQATKLAVARATEAATSAPALQEVAALARQLGLPAHERKALAKAAALPKPVPTPAPALAPAAAAREAAPAPSWTARARQAYEDVAEMVATLFGARR